MNDTFNKNDDVFDPGFSIDDANTEKLDMYGVWIKKKPGDTTEFSHEKESSDIDELENIDIDDMFSFTDEDIPAIEPLNIGGLEELEQDIDMANSSNEDNNVLEEDNFEALDLDDFFDDADLMEEALPEPAPLEKPVEQDVTDADIGTADSFDIDDSPEDDLTDFEEITPIEPIELDDVEDTADIDGFSEISLDDFDDITAEDSSGTDAFEAGDDFDDFLDSPPAETESAEAKKVKSETLDLSVSVDEDGNKQQVLSDFSSQDSDADADIPIFDEVDEDEAETEEKTAHRPTFFDDVQAVEKDLLSENTDANKKGEADSDSAAGTPEQDTQMSGNDKSTELLMQIAYEISGLKAELTSIKETLSAQASAGIAPAAHAGNADEKQDPSMLESKDEENSGFFSDDDTDETIALTGDELNNILITADFTEESSSEDDTGDDYEIPEVLTENMLPNIDEVQTADTEHEEESSLDEFAESEMAAGKNDESMFGIEALPISPLPEDLSYLDNETIDPSEHLAAMEGVDIMPNDSSVYEDTFKEADSIFDVPEKQEISVPDIEPFNPIDSASSASSVLESRKMEEPEDTYRPEDSERFDEIDIEEDIPELEAGEETMEIETIEIPDFSAEEQEYGDVSETPKNGNQETLLKAAEQLIREEQERTVSIPIELKNEIKSVLAYMDRLLEALPEKKIEEFAKSEYFETYKHLFEELGIS